MADRKRLRNTVRLSSALILGSLTALFAGASAIGSPDVSAAQNPVWKNVLRMHDRIQLAFGSDLLGDVYIVNGRMLCKNPDVPQEQIEPAAAAINQFAENMPAPVYLLLVPTSSGIYADTLPANAPIGNEHAALKTFSELRSDKTVWIEAESWLAAEREQYLYYRTDPCWTGYGAYTVYRTAIRKLGFTAIGYDHFVITQFSADYYGQLARSIQYYDITPDTIDLYASDTEQPLKSITALRSDGTKEEFSSLYNMSPETPDAVFRTETEPVLSIETENQSNKDLLLLTDSFGNSMVPLLLQHYHTVTVVNLGLTEHFDAARLPLPLREYEQIMILCGTDTAAAEDGLAAVLTAAPEPETNG